MWGAQWVRQNPDRIVLMTKEGSTEQQYNIPLGVFSFQFSKQGPDSRELLLKTGISPEKICFPDYYPGYDEVGWTDYRSTPTLEAFDLLLKVQRESGFEVAGVDLFNRVITKLKESGEYVGRTSHILLSMLNEEKIFEDLVRDTQTGERINPTFTSDSKTLPPNLLVRNSILVALESDRDYHKGMIGGHSDFPQQRVEWYQKVIDKMTQYTEIKPAEKKLV